MRAFISKSEIRGKIAAPSSKSYTIRGLMCTALTKGTSEIISPLISDDTEAAIDVLTNIGVRFSQGTKSWQVTGGDFHIPGAPLYCRESAATLRFMTAICSLVPGQCELHAAPSLAVRPIMPLIKALKQLGIDCHYQKDKKCIVVKGGALKSGVAELPGNISSQFVSALLLISPFVEDEMIIRLTASLESKPYVLMTMECLQEFGITVSFSEDLREFVTPRQPYNPVKYTVEGDWSSASYLLASGALCGEIKVSNLHPRSLQGDSLIVDFLKEMEAPVTTVKGSVTVKRSRLKAIKADLTDCIDLLPTLAVLAAAARGTSVFTGIERARLKESNRVIAIREGLAKMGIETEEERNRLTITGATPEGAVIDSRGDHRIAMAFSLLGTLAGNTIIKGAECVIKTYPEFWDTLKSIGGEVKLDE